MKFNRSKFERFYVNTAGSSLILCAVLTSIFGKDDLPFSGVAVICLTFGCAVAYYFHQWHEKEEKKALQNEKRVVEGKNGTVKVSIR